MCLSLVSVDHLISFINSKSSTPFCSSLFVPWGGFCQFFFFPSSFLYLLQVIFIHILHSIISSSDINPCILREIQENAYVCECNVCMLHGSFLKWQVQITYCDDVAPLGTVGKNQGHSIIQAHSSIVFIFRRPVLHFTIRESIKTKWFLTKQHCCPELCSVHHRRMKITSFFRVFLSFLDFNHLPDHIWVWCCLHRCGRH